MKGILRHKQVIVFDFDGLLVNTEEIYWDGWKFAFQENNISVSNQLISSFTGKSIEEVDRLLLNQELISKCCKDFENLGRNIL
ncbi:HAD hydrolase-like protein [Streptococcus lactarius]|uniref:HAD hydrolase-like protein n=1 Tax=Streptococcus lactarius TaxID=684066 RepID=UPI003617C53E